MSNDNKLYVGNLPFSTSQDDLSKLFAEYGTVKDTRLITDRDTGRSRGFGFVEMSSSNEAQEAISALHGTNLDDRDLVVNIARPKRENTNRSGRY